MLFRKIYLFMSICLSSSPAFAEKNNPKIVVIGGGLAGLTAAYRLQQKGMDIELYEARGRVGGRVLTVDISGSPAELGGQSITDGGKAPNILQLIREFNLELTELRISLSHYFFDGNELISINERPFDQEKLKTQLNNLKSSCHNMKEVLDMLFEKDSILYRNIAARLAAYEGGAIEKLSSEYVETLFYMLSGGVCSVHQNDQVNLVSIKGGNSRLPEKIAKALGNKLHMNMPLVQVSEDPNGTYMLTFENGEKVSTDILILAIPCSVLERVVFQNEIIDKERLSAMKSLSYGTNAKILVPFRGIRPPLMGLVEDHTVNFFGNESILTMYRIGKASQFSDDEVANIYNQSRPTFDTAFEDICFSSKAAVYAKDIAFAHYDSPVGYSWPNDPYAQGSYSYIGAGQEMMLAPTYEENGETFKTLFAPIKGKLYFAGEHATINEDIRGTMEAACESGERCARAIWIQKSTRKAALNP